MKKINLLLLAALLTLSSCNGGLLDPSESESEYSEPDYSESEPSEPDVSESESEDDTETPLVQYLIKFVTNGGSEVQDMIYVVGDDVVLPTTKRNGYTFAGWYFDNETFTSKCHGVSDITGNVTLYAKWVVKSVKIYLDTYYEGEFEPIIKEVGEMFYASELPSTIRAKKVGRLEYGFTEWKDAGENAPTDFVVKDQYYAFHSLYGAPTYSKDDILYQNDFNEDYGYLDKNASWEKIRDWPVKNADSATTYRTPYINQTKGVEVLNGELTVNASFSGLHYVNNGVYLPEIAYKDTNNYSVSVKVKFDKVLTSGDAKSKAYDSGFGIAVRQNENDKAFIATMLDPNAKALRVAARNASNVGSGTDINGKIYYDLPSSYNQSTYHTVKVVVSGTGTSSTLKAYFDDTLAYTYTDSSAGKTWLKAATGNKIALFGSGCTFTIDEVVVKTIDESETLYQTDFSNYNTNNVFDGWSQNTAYSISRSGDFEIEDGKLHLNDATEVSIYSHQMLHSPLNNFKDGIIEFDVTITDRGSRQWDDPDNHSQTKYFGLVLRAGNVGYTDYGVVMFRQYGRVQLTDHVNQSWGSNSFTLQGNSATTEFKENETYRICVVVDGTTVMLFINDNYVNEANTKDTTLFRYEEGNIGLLSSSISTAIDNLTIAKIAEE